MQEALGYQAPTNKEEKRERNNGRDGEAKMLNKLGKTNEKIRERRGEEKQQSRVFQTHLAFALQKGGKVSIARGEGGNTCLRRKEGTREVEVSPPEEKPRLTLDQNINETGGRTPPLPSKPKDPVRE